MKENRICYIYVLNTLADWEIGFLTAELKSKRFLSGTGHYDLRTIGSSLESIQTMGGLEITPENTIEEIDFREGDLLILPGADTWMEDKNDVLLKRLPVLLEKKVLVAAICGATFALAKSGILNDRAHTSNDKNYLQMVCPEYSGSSLYKDTPVCIDRNLITASGFAPLEFASEIFRITNVMKEDTVEAWYRLFQTKESKYFFNLMESLQ